MTLTALTLYNQPERGRLEGVRYPRVEVRPVSLVGGKGLTQEGREVLVRDDALRKKLNTCLNRMLN